jgi:two-component system CheB/CheR fusion protein
VPVELGGRQAVMMNVIVHELTTNAAKYGALSHSDGQLSIDWTVDPAMRGAFVLYWKEQCRHSIAPPLDRRFGLQLLRSSARGGLHGDVSFEFGSTGLTATLVAPASHLKAARTVD